MQNENLKRERDYEDLKRFAESGNNSDLDELIRRIMTIKRSENNGQFAMAEYMHEEGDKVRLNNSKLDAILEQQREYEAKAKMLNAPTEEVTTHAPNKLLENQNEMALEQRIGLVGKLNRGRGKKRGPKPPRQVQYGRLLVDVDKLKANTFSCRYTDARCKPRQLKNRKVNEKVKAKMIELMERNEADLSDLGIEDANFVAEYAKSSQQSPVLHGMGAVDSSRALVERYDILTGMIKAGNRSKEIKKELSELINTMVQQGLLTVGKAVRITNQLLSKS